MSNFMKYFLTILFFLPSLLSAMENKPEWLTIENKLTNLTTSVEGRMTALCARIEILEKSVDKLALEIEHLKDSQKIAELRYQYLSLQVLLPELSNSNSASNNK